jgi:hypothetical protein
VERFVEKTVGGVDYLVPNPDLLDSEGNFKKVRSKNTHLTPKKKKRR